MASTRPYYAPASLSVAFYDLVTAADDELAGDIDLYAGLAATPDATILELGAGAGRVAFALAQRGFTVTGVDISPAMLARAEAARADLNSEVSDRVTLRRGDMTSLDLKQIFGLVLCPYFTLAHVPTGAAWRNTFATAAHHLAPGGLAAFHLPLLEIMRRPGPANPQLPVLDRPLGDGRRLQLYIRERGFREGVGRLDQVIEYVELDPKGRVLRRSPERLTYYLTDPAPLAASAGLALDRPPVALGGVGEVWVFRKG